MSELGFLVLPKHWDELTAFIETNHTRGGSVLLPREIFLGELWRSLSIFVRNNRDNMLIRHSVSVYPNLIHRAFVLLSVWYGSRADTPVIKVVLLEFLEMLKNDLDVIERNILHLAMTQKGKQYLPEITAMWNAVRTIYDREDKFDLGVLPATVHHAFVLIANRNQKLIFSRNIEPESLYGHIHVLMRKYNAYYAESESQAA